MFLGANTKTWLFSQKFKVFYLLLNGVVCPTVMSAWHTAAKIWQE